MPNYKLIYFPIKGLGEPIRFLFHYAEVPFEDVHIDSDDWPKIKSTTPYGQVPMLEIDGKKFAQTNAILRYLAKQFGLIGKNDLEALEIDATVDTIKDIDVRLVAIHYEDDAATKERKRKIAEEQIPPYLEHLDAQVKNNGGYFVGGALSWADLSFVAQIDTLSFMWKADLVEKYENLKQLREKVLNLPAIKRWVEKRPESEY